ncbi:molybdopterin-binding protein [Maritimibacter sp. HL-12]|uniref:molybdopterin-binding protein n=1 Tax=Maritimibacter sp. HL-12 TaxID=1162418 RepID=UPI000A0F140E|nr:molybdopterin-binding protein [Maritimibacter sp. HL-12]SMH31591.1 molybdenum cofactor cytidylyltransferase [Maritimibacter sp. HL-12]
MEFGPVPVAEAVGAVLAHSVALPGGSFRKGRVLTRDDVAALAAGGIAVVTVARSGPDDIGEDEAAAALARALVPDPGAAGLRLATPHTGRVNIHAESFGLARLDVSRLHAVNAVSELISLATVAPWTSMGPGGLVATVKIIPYAIDAGLVVAAEAAGRGALTLAPITVTDADLIVTTHAAGSAEDTGKGPAAIEARLSGLGMRLARVVEVPHEIGPLAAAIAEARAGMVLVLTASATSDPRDTGPEALRRAGGRVVRVGMPVDPGNLLFYGSLADGRPAIGLPGCARSPARNGADHVLERLAAGLDLAPQEVAAMGVGGLLKESPGRRQPRERKL